MATDFSCHVVYAPEGAVIRLAGALSHATAPALAESLAEVQKRKPKRVAFDLSDLWSADSVGLGTWRSITQEFRDFGCALGVANSPPSLERTMRQLAMDLGIQFIDDAERFIWL